MITKTEVHAVKSKILANKEFANRVAKEILSFQTDQEFDEMRTIFKNRVGFNKNDAPRLTELVMDLEVNGFLSDSDQREVQRRAKKYARQWLMIDELMIMETDSYLR